MKTDGVEVALARGVSLDAFEILSMMSCPCLYASMSAKWIASRIGFNELHGSGY